MLFMNRLFSNGYVFELFLILDSGSSVLSRIHLLSALRYPRYNVASADFILCDSVSQTILHLTLPVLEVAPNIYALSSMPYTSKFNLR